jgi:ankyrin repeat protein
MKSILCIVLSMIFITLLYAGGPPLEETYGVFLAHVIRGEYEAVAALLKKGADANQKGPYGKTALWHALDSYRKDVALLLINHGADIEARNKSKETPLLTAAKWGWSEVVEVLIAKGSALDAVDDRGRTALHGMILHAFELPQEIGDLRSPGQLKEYHEVFEFLLQSGIDINKKDKAGKTALQYAAEFTDYYYSASNEYPVLESIILRLVRDGAVTEDIDTAIRIKQYEKLEELISKETDSKKLNRLVFFAIERHDLKSVSLLLDGGADIEARDSTQNTPLLAACQKSANDIVDLLLDRKCLVNTCNAQGITPLMYIRDESLVQRLIQTGANIEERDNKGRTALAYAVLEFSVKKVGILLEGGADIHVRDNEGRSILMLLSYSRNTERRSMYIFLFKKYGLKPYDLISAVILGDKQAVIKYVLTHKNQLQAGDDKYDSLSALHFAVIDNRLEIITMLIIKGAPIDVRTKGLGTPLHYAVRNLNIAAAELLLKNGADVNSQDGDGETPLFVAARMRRTDVPVTGMIELLLRYKAQVNILNKRGGSPLAGASAEVTQLLLDHGADANYFSNSRFSPLAKALSDGDNQTAAILLKAGADPDITVRWNMPNGPVETALMDTADREIFIMLLDAGADAALPSGFNENIFVNAFKRGHIWKIEELKKRGYYLTPTEDSLRLRKAPDLDAPVIRLLKKGERLEFISTDPYTTEVKLGYWIKIKTQNGEHGWCFDAYVAVEN